jgi:hypothetical protein
VFRLAFSGRRRARRGRRCLSTGVREPATGRRLLARRKESAMDRDTSAARADDEGTPKPGGLGQDETIPDDPDGVAAGHTGEPSTFEPEEDEQA